MPENLGKPPTDFPPGVELKDEDIYEAMKAIPGYLDITPGDFKEVYHLAYRHALERLSRAVTAREIMTREVVAVPPETPLAKVAEAMGRRGISGVPVVDAAGRVLGVISEKDFLTQMGLIEPRNFMSLVASCLQKQGCVALPIKPRQAGDLMSSPAVTVGPETSVKDIAALFTAKGINRVPVTDAAGLLLGIVSRGDIVKAAIGGGAQ
ncbi:MAG: CBS domain-containing protein [Deltaproteobacteria bacterium]|nr:CBS domain-containing protein [Deltaproteobacteria bacterium]